MTLPVAILAGGLATRLRPVTETIPKSLIEVRGEPFVFHQLRLLARRGITRAVLCVGYLGEQIEAAVGRGDAFGLGVDYVFDGPKLLGTAGAIRNALPNLGPDFFITYGDSYLDCDYAAIAQAYARSGLPALMTVFANDSQWDTSNVEFDNGRIVKYSKRHKNARMHHIDWGLGVASRAVFEDLPPGEAVDLADIYSKLAEAGKLSAFEVSQRFYEIGSWAGIADLSNYLGKGDSVHAKTHLDEAKRIIDGLDCAAIEAMARALVELRHRGGRLFFVGVGGSAGNCSHAVNDFRKIVGIESYAPTDNVSELTARTNDEGWDTVFSEWLRVSRLSSNDAIFVMSVGGGNLEKNISPNLVKALELAKSVGAKIFGIVGRDGGHTAKVGQHVIVVPTVNPDSVTPHTEAFQAVVWHLLVSHPHLKSRQTKWESVAR